MKDGTIVLGDFNIYSQRQTWCFLKDGKKLASWYKFMALDLEVCVSLMNRMEHLEVGIFKNLDTNV